MTNTTTKIDEESFKIGRTLSKRKDLIDRAKNMATIRGKKRISDVIEEALDLYEKLYIIQDIDMPTFIKASTIYKSMMLDAIDMLAEMFALFNTETGKKLLKTVITTTETMETPEETGETVKQEEPRQIPETEEIINMRKELIKMLIDMLKTLLITITTTTAKTPKIETDISDIRIE